MGRSSGECAYQLQEDGAKYQWKGDGGMKKKQTA